MKKLTVRQHAGIQTFWNILAVALVLPNFFLEDKPTWTIWLGIGCVIIGVVWRVIFIKCPHCGDGLTGSRIVPKTCPSCGKSLDEHPEKES